MNTTTATTAKAFTMMARSLNIRAEHYSRLHDELTPRTINESPALCEVIDALRDAAYGLTNQAKESTR